MKRITLLLAVFLAGIIQAQTFTGIPVDVTPMFFASVDFGDFDNDGDQDLAIIGVDDSFSDVADIFRNDDGVFSPLNAGISPMHMGAVSWADYDGDGDLDLFCSGQDYSMSAYATIYSNDNGVFTAVSTGLPPGFWTSGGWGDYDLDGDLDLAYSWYAGNVAYSSIFRNDDGAFTDIQAGLPGLTAGSMEWGDFDGDGDPDLLFTGTPTDFSSTLVLLYENIDGTFVDAGTGLMDCAWYNNACWGDVDNDGDLDILYMGDNGIDYPFVVYFNDDGSFELLNTGLNGVRTSNGNIGVVTGDIDNDGDLDVVNTGDDQDYNKATKIFLNDNATFTILEHDIPGFGSGSLDLSDIDCDGDLDIFLIGYDSGFSGSAGMYINDANSNSYSVNAAPTAPGNLSSLVEGDAVSLSWDAASDDHTPENSLQYNVYIGTDNGLGDIVCAQSITDPLAANNGFHLLPVQGNAGMNLSFELAGLEDDVYLWSVQAIDQSGVASEFAAEACFEVGNVSSVAEPASSITVYPNPAVNKVMVDNPDRQKLRIRITNICGQRVYETCSCNAPVVIDVQTLNPGFYFVDIQQGKSIETTKLQILP